MSRQYMIFIIKNQAQTIFVPYMCGQAFGKPKNLLHYLVRRILWERYSRKSL